MRQLTKTEIDKAPEWATHYNIGFNHVLFESDTDCVMLVNGELLDVKNYGPQSICKTSQPIPR